MRFLHVLLAVGFAFGSICTGLIVALVLWWSSVVLVVDVPVTFLLSWPTMLVILALYVRTLPGPRMCFLVLGQITGSLKLFLAITANVHDVAGLV